MVYKIKNDVDQIAYANFLDTVKVLKMLFGRQIAENFFTDNMSVFYDVDSESKN